MKEPQTINALSETFKTDRRTLKRVLAKVKPVRVEGRSKLYDVAVVADVLAQHIKKSKSPSPLDQQIKEEKLRKLKLENDAFAGKFISREELAGRLKALCAEVNGTLIVKLTQEWPAAGAGMPADELRRLGQDQHTKIVDRFKEFAAQWTTPQNFQCVETYVAD